MKSCSLIYFSPTGTTRRIVEAIGRGVGAEKINSLDLTRSEARGCGHRDVNPGLAIIGVPVYTGRVAFQAVEVLQRFRAQNTPAIIVVVYGNRAYEDALCELKDVAIRTGFVPVAGAAFVGEHSFSTSETPIAAGRPDSKDLDAAVAFGQRIREKFEGNGWAGEAKPLTVPGTFPYRDRALHAAAPESDGDLCTLCGTCQDVCPQKAISVSDGGVASDREACILCCACVKSCPTGARRMVDPALRKIVDLLTAKCVDRKEPEFFIK